MDGIFSHAPNPEPDIAQKDVLHARTAAVLVPVRPDFAFDGFTDGLHLWWPMDRYSGYGPESHAGFEDNRLLEESPDGQQQIWAEVAEWTPPSSLVLRWQLAGSPLVPTTLTVTFDAVDGGTRVTLVHDGWATGALGCEQYDKYCDWPLILSKYARFMGGAPGLD